MNKTHEKNFPVKSNNIVLCGFMGCGKTTVGLHVAQMLDRQFIDSDDYIENKFQMKIPKIFEKYGITHFRELERDAILELSKLSEIVISTGGGVVLNSDNVKALKTTGYIFYIEITPQIVLERLKNDTSRPLLMKSNKEQAINDLMEKRSPIYLNAADFRVDGSLSPKCISKQIISAFGR